jgi:hypothetical protein
LKLTDVLPAIERMRRKPDVVDQRAFTYLLTYPTIISRARALNLNENSSLHELALLAYGWMPRVVRLNSRLLHDARQALQASRETKRWDMSVAQSAMLALEPCLFSAVGASKVLHFLNPEVFPIWDSRIEKFRCPMDSIRQGHMRSKRYFIYADEVQHIRANAEFSSFYREFTHAFENRLRVLNLEPYPISEVRAVELAAFELAGGKAEDTENRLVYM